MLTGLDLAVPTAAAASSSPGLLAQAAWECWFPERASRAGYVVGSVPAAPVGPSLVASWARIARWTTLAEVQDGTSLEETFVRLVGERRIGAEELAWLAT